MIKHDEDKVKEIEAQEDFIRFLTGMKIKAEDDKFKKECMQVSSLAFEITSIMRKIMFLFDDMAQEESQDTQEVEEFLEYLTLVKYGLDNYKETHSHE